MIDAILKQRLDLFIRICDSLGNLPGLACAIKDKKLRILHNSKHYRDDMDHAVNNAIIECESTNITTCNYAIYIAYIESCYFIIVLLQKPQHIETQIYHDIQEPLRCVANCLQIASFFSIGENEVSKYISYSLENIMHLKNWTTELLGRKFSNHINREAFYISDVIDKIKKMLNFQLENGNCIIEMDNIPKIYAVKADIICVFKNLIENSLQYFKNKGKLLISIKNNLSKTTNDDICITFYDSGNAQSKCSDSGIGLSLCKEMLIANGGALLCQDNYVYDIVLPKA